ncbi:MAG: UbiA family prenyltransferase [Candidatus Hydrothermarchaeales archaeon]
MFQYVRILRPLNCAMAGIAVIVGAVVASDVFPVMKIALAFWATFMICGAGNVVNDFFDYEIDKINNPLRPLPSGAIPLNLALYYALSLFVLGVLASAFINIYALVIALFNSLLLYVYAQRIKKGGGIKKNLTVSYLVASPFFFGGIAVMVVGKPLVTLLLALIAAFANTGREIAKDIEDYKGDSMFIKTLPARVGFEKASRLAGAFLFATVVLSPLPYFFGILNWYYLLIVLAADVVVAYAAMILLRNSSDPVKASESQRMIKIGMLLALAAFFVGSL